MPKNSRCIDANCVKEHRLGKFYISNHVMSVSSQQMLSSMLRDCFVVRAEQLWERDAFEYIAYNPAFDILEEGHRAPEYECEINAINEVTWIRLQ